MLRYVPRRLFSGFCTLVLLGSLVSVAAADRRDFTVYNKGEETIYHLNVSHISEDNWGPDIMASDETLGPDEHLKVTFSGDSDLCYYDVRAVYADGDKREQRNIDLCSTESISFYH